MSNNIGIQIKDGALLLNNKELASASVNNTFNKIVVLGTSIEVTPSSDSSWPKQLATSLGLNYYYNTNNVKKGVVSYAKGGGQLCWFGNDYPMYYGADVDVNVYDGAILNGFSITQQERESAIEYYSDTERWTINGNYVGLKSDDITQAENNHYENFCYDNSLLGNLDADLFIFGTTGINDRPSTRLTFTDANGNTCKTSTIRNDGLYNFDRRTIFGAYNYVLRALYRANPSANVVILGQHTRQWADQNIVNDLQMSVADFWRIPFANWGTHLPLNGTFAGATAEGANKKVETFFQTDAVHLSGKGAQLLGAWVAEWITDTELKPLNPRWAIE